jgi:hypothetical protein
MRKPSASLRRCRTNEGWRWDSALLGGRGAQANLKGLDVP